MDDGKIAWSKLGSTTLASANSVISSTITSKKFSQILHHNTGQSSAQAITTRVGNTTVDSGSNYAYRDSTNGSADSTDINQTLMPFMGAGLSTPRFTVIYCLNISNQEKLFYGFEVSQNDVGASNTPSRTEQVNKWSNTSNQIDIISFSPSSGTFSTDSNIMILGTD